MTKKISYVVNYLRIQRGWSQRQLAQHAHLSNTEISRIESGERKVLSLPVIEKLCSAFELDKLLFLSLIGQIPHYQEMSISSPCPLSEQFYQLLKDLQNPELSQAWEHLRTLPENKRRELLTQLTPKTKKDS